MALAAAPTQRATSCLPPTSGSGPKEEIHRFPVLALAKEGDAAENQTGCYCTLQASNKLRPCIVLQSTVVQSVALKPAEGGETHTLEPRLPQRRQQQQPSARF